MTVDFNSYTPLNTQSTVITWQGLTFTKNIGDFMYVWDGSSPNGNGTPALIFAGFGSGGSVTITNAMGGSFNLLSAAMTISWYDGNASETIPVTAMFAGGGISNFNITLIQGLQTYNFNLNGLTSITFGDVPSGSGYWLMDDVKYSIVPEPGSLIMLGTGVLAGFGVIRRRLMA